MPDIFNVDNLFMTKEQIAIQDAFTTFCNLKNMFKYITKEHKEELKELFGITELQNQVSKHDGELGLHRPMSI